MVLGLFYGRITVIKLPAEAAPAVTVEAIEHARERKAVAPLSDDDVTSAVVKAAAGYLQLTADDT